MRLAVFIAIAVGLLLSEAVPNLAQPGPLRTAPQQASPKEDIDCKNPEDAAKRAPTDGTAQFQLGMCYYALTRAANDTAAAANRALISFVDSCNQALSCNSPESRRQIEDLQATQDLKVRDYKSKLDKAIDAFARRVEIGGSGPEVEEARNTLEKLKKARGNR